ncbi:hypothetical protein EJ05DRAFT_500429 [Pseudovirgaria hyperparasitica]|uniref:Transcription regulator Rua1 C-terminal domain-containing protein n=1 Tax=Pseudovirgaria hyperparasitica TaxID=470096 RepID=A0A6A6W5T3_9PEZI|nr:uncharacterized protein EJ05DRAFT_500429 [Pseudovirgaria hyperparasitica]KAF2757905.1 hypothetical protein EJ05DRAFT_500429 [Pseudovirgaria hyperparasitica]
MAQQQQQQYPEYFHDDHQTNTIHSATQCPGSDSTTTDDTGDLSENKNHDRVDAVVKQEQVCVRSSKDQTSSEAVTSSELVECTTGPSLDIQNSFIDASLFNPPVTSIHGMKSDFDSSQMPAPWGYKGSGDIPFPPLDGDVSELGQNWLGTDDDGTVIDLRRFLGADLDGDLSTFNVNSRRISESSFSMSSCGALAEVLNFEDLSGSETQSRITETDGWGGVHQSAMLVSPASSSRSDEAFRPGHRSKASPSSRMTMRTSPYTIDKNRLKRWSTTAASHASTSAPSSIPSRHFSHIQGRLSPYSRPLTSQPSQNGQGVQSGQVKESEEIPQATQVSLAQYASYPVGAYAGTPQRMIYSPAHNQYQQQCQQQYQHALSQSHIHAQINSHSIVPSCSNPYQPNHVQSSMPSYYGPDSHQYPLEIPRPVPSQNLFRLLQSNADRHGGYAAHFADLSDPPDLYSSLQEEPSNPPESDMHPSDPDLIPHEQDLRFSGDLYTPRWVRGHGNKREGWCGLCKPGRWLVLKNSAFWYDKSFTHGVSAATGVAFQKPQETRRTEGNLDVWEGLCGSCGDWIALVSSKKKGTTWFRHAYKCHTHPKVKDGPKRRRETSHQIRARTVSSASTTTSTSYPTSKETSFDPSPPLLQRSSSEATLTRMSAPGSDVYCIPASSADAEHVGLRGVRSTLAEII